MAAKVQCPECDSVSSTPDAFLNKKVRCANCKAVFVATPMDAVKTSVKGPPAAITVVARRVGADRGAKAATAARGSPLWLLAGVLALLLPVAAAGGFAALAWNRAGAGAAEPGETYGVIEIGSSSVKCVAFEIVPHPEWGHDFNIKAEETKNNTNLVPKDMEKTGELDALGLTDTVEAVSKFYDRLTNEHKVPPERVFIVGSSGLVGALANRGEAEKGRLIEASRAALRGPIHKATGKTVEFVDADEETRWQIEGVVPEPLRNSALCLDVGSGSTRGGYRERAGLEKIFQGPGTKEFQGKVVAARNKEPRPRPFPDVAAGLAPRELGLPFRQQIEGDPELGNRDPVYLVGGIVWVMANYEHPDNRDKYVVITHRDIEHFAKALSANPPSLDALFAGLSEEKQAKLGDDLPKMREAFPDAKRLIAGSQVLLALSTELKFADGQRTVKFYRYGHIAWFLEYVRASKTRVKK